MNKYGKRCSSHNGSALARMVDDQGQRRGVSFWGLDVIVEIKNGVRLQNSYDANQSLPDVDRVGGAGSGGMYRDC
jgi:hypothetical protein